MSNSITPTTVHGLVCHDHVDMAYKGYTSLLKFSVAPLQLVIHDDGSLTLEDIEKLKSIEGSKIICRAEADELMNPLLKNYPNCYNIRYEHPMFLKLLDTALLSESDFAYCDTDILFFQAFDGMFQWPNSQVSAIFMQDYLEAYSVFPWQLLGNSDLKLPSKVNAGLMFIRKSAYDLDFVEWFLGKKEFRSKPVHKMEQTCWAALGYRVGCHLWNPEKIVLMRPDSVLTDQLVAGHFVKEVRYLLNKFYSYTQTDLDAQSNQPIIVQTIPSQDCDVLGLAKNHIKRQTNRVQSHQRKLTTSIQNKLFGG